MLGAAQSPQALDVLLSFSTAGIAVFACAAQIAGVVGRAGGPGDGWGREPPRDRRVGAGRPVARRRNPGRDDPRAPRRAIRPFLGSLAQALAGMSLYANRASGAGTGHRRRLPGAGRSADGVPQALVHLPGRRGDLRRCAIPTTGIGRRPSPSRIGGGGPGVARGVRGVPRSNAGAHHLRRGRPRHRQYQVRCRRRPGAVGGEMSAGRVHRDDHVLAGGGGRNDPLGAR